jgi:DNA-binding transcriptional LysR family regulator
MVRLRDEAMRRLAEQRNLDSGTLSIVAHESAAVYLLPGPLRRYFDEFPQIKVGIYRSRLDEIPRQVMDREVDIGFVKDRPAFHELQSVLIHRDEMILIASPRHRLVSRARVSVRDLGEESFVLHHLCSSTEQKITRLFEAHGTRLRVAAELWSFENVKQFVRQDVGLAIVPRVSVAQELGAEALVEVPVEGLHMPRETHMVFRDRTYLSPPARQFIDVVDGFEWGAWLPWEPAAGARPTSVPAVPPARPVAGPEGVVRARRANAAMATGGPRPVRPSLARRR